MCVCGGGDKKGIVSPSWFILVLIGPIAVLVVFCFFLRVPGVCFGRGGRARGCVLRMRVPHLPLAPKSTPNRGTRGLRAWHAVGRWKTPAPGPRHQPLSFSHGKRVGTRVLYSAMRPGFESVPCRQRNPDL